MIHGFNNVFYSYISCLLNFALVFIDLVSDIIPSLLNSNYRAIACGIKVIFDARLPAHSTEQADCLHVIRRVYMWL